jgi:hypothetical protein
MQWAAYGACIGGEPAANIDTAPIHIDLCRGPASWHNQNVELKFHKLAPIAARQIVFSVTIGNEDLTIRSPRKPQIICKAGSVDFVNGAHWSHIQPGSQHE